MIRPSTFIASMLCRMSDADGMRVVAARFDDPLDAAAVERELRGVLDVEEADIRQHSLGGELGAPNATVLGGRFRQERLVLVEDVIREHNGEILADVPEAWT